MYEYHAEIISCLTKDLGPLLTERVKLKNQGLSGDEGRWMLRNVMPRQGPAGGKLADTRVRIYDILMYRYQGEDDVS